MRRNPTLPTIRQPPSSSNPKPKQGVESFRKIEDKLTSHDEQIVKNEKIISTLANEFRMLKEQLQFEQEYSQKYKNTMNKYQEDTAKHLKVIRDQKQMIGRLEHLIREKEKVLEGINRERQVWREKIEEATSSFEEVQRDNKRKQATIKQMQALFDKAKKEIKEKDAEIKAKDAEIKQKENEIREAFGADRQLRETKIKKLQKDLQMASMLLQNIKEIVSSKDKEIHRISIQLFQTEEKLKQLDKTELKSKTMVEEIKLVQRENEDLKKKLKDSEDQVKNMEVMIKTQESKNITNNSEKVKQLQQEKKDLTDKLDKLTKESQQFRRKMDSERKQREKVQKKQQQTRQRLSKLQTFSDKLSKSKVQITQQLSKLKANVQCDYCCKPMKNPVTNIPCGHSYCQECKAGYLKECKKCSGVKREAVYRNQLLDQIIHASNLIQKMILLMNN